MSLNPYKNTFYRLEESGLERLNDCLKFAQQDTSN